MTEPTGEGYAMKILEAIGDIKASMSGLQSDVSYLRKRVDDLWSKVDEIERSKATRADLQEVEIRMEKSVAQVKAQVGIDLSRFDHDKIGHDQFSVDSFDNVVVRLDCIEGKIDKLTSMEEKLDRTAGLAERHENWRWYVIGAAAALITSGGILGWIVHEAAAMMGRH